MTLAEDEDDITRPCCRHCCCDRTAPIRDLHDVDAALDRTHSVEHCCADDGGVLRPRVVVGDNDHVPTSRRGLAHVRSLVRVAITASAEHDDDAPEGSTPHRCDGALDCIGSVCVVDEGEQPAPGIRVGDAFHAPWDSRARGDASGSSHPFNARRGEQGERAERVRHVEFTRESHLERDVGAAWTVSCHDRPTGHRDDTCCRPRRVVAGHGVRRARNAGAARALENSISPGVVDAHHSAVGAFAREQRRLGLEVVIHVVVEIEVIFGEVGESSHGEPHPVDATEAKRVAGDLHGHRRDASFAHDSEKGVDVGRLRCRAHRGHDVVTDSSSDCADDSGDVTGGAEARIHEVARGRLSVGAGDAHDRQIVGGVGIDVRRQRPQYVARLVDDQDGHRVAEGAIKTSRIGQDRHGAGTDCVGDELRAMSAEPRQCRIDVARDHSAGVVSDSADLDVRGAGITVNVSAHPSGCSLKQPGRGVRTGARGHVVTLTRAHQLIGRRGDRRPVGGTR